jgi:hypothetical protein
MRSHFRPDPRVLLACAAGASTMLTGIANAAQIASDTPADPVYADGWQEGDNGGFGFTAWSFLGSYTSPVLHALDSTSPYNQLGLAWTLYLANGNLPQQSPDSPNPPPPPGDPTDLSRAGRGFAAGSLQVGQTLSVVIDNPTERTFFKGYTINLITGGKCAGFFPACTGTSRLRVGTFEYFTYGRWYIDSVAGGSPTLFDTDTAAGGMRLDVTLTGANTYSLVMTPLANPSNAFTNSGTLNGTGPIDWIQFEHYNTDSDFYPTVVTNPQSTDFYISSMQVTGPDGGGGTPSVEARPAPNGAGKNPPSGKQTTANPDGFYQLLAEDDNDPNPKIYVADSESSFVAGPFANGDLVKITRNSGSAAGQKPGGGVVAHITLNGTGLIYATDSDGNSSTPVPIP